MVELSDTSAIPIQKLDKKLNRKRDKSSLRFDNNSNFSRTRKHRVYDYDSLSWLANNYIKKMGLRKWTWKVIIDGIIVEQIRSIENLTENDMQNVRIMWHTFISVAGITNLREVP